MKTNILFALFIAFTVSLSAQTEKYYMSKTLQLPLNEATAKVKAALKTEGFGIVAESDMDKMLKEKLGDIEMKPYRVLGACNAKIAYKALLAEENIAIYLPCKVILKFVDEYKTEVVFVNPAVAMSPVKNPEAQKIMTEVSQIFKKVFEGI